MPEKRHEIVEHIGIISEGKRGWNKEINIVSWNKREPTYDIRTWSPDHETPGKGLAISIAEAKAIRDILNSLDLDDTAKLEPAVAEVAED